MGHKLVLPISGLSGKRYDVAEERNMATLQKERDGKILVGIYNPAVVEENICLQTPIF